MSKKDYEAIARAIHRFRVLDARTDEQAAQDNTAAAISHALADVFAADSPRFDRARFVTACETRTCKGMRK